MIVFNRTTTVNSHNFLHWCKVDDGMNGAYVWSLAMLGQFVWIWVMFEHSSYANDTLDQPFIIGLFVLWDFLSNRLSYT